MLILCMYMSGTMYTCATTPILIIMFVKLWLMINKKQQHNLVKKYIIIYAVEDLLLVVIFMQ